MELHHAIIDNDINRVERIIASGNYDRDICFGALTHIHMAIYSFNIDIVRLLIDAKFDINIMPYQWTDPSLIYAIKLFNKCDTMEAKSDLFEIVKLLVESGAHIDNMVILHACMYDYPLLVSYLSSFNISINDVFDENDDTPMHYAAFNGREQVVAYLIASGAKLNEVNRENKTPLVDAINKNHLKIVKMLVNAGVSINDIPEKDSILYYPMLDKNIELIDYLIDQGANTDFDFDIEFLDPAIIDHVNEYVDMLTSVKEPAI